MPRISRKHIKEALQILRLLGMPRAQQNERSAYTLLALLNLKPQKLWEEAENQLLGITPIMDWIQQHYKKKYAPNTRETIRRQTIHQFVQAGIVLYNPDDPDRPVNSPKAVYQIEPFTLGLLRDFGKPKWEKNLKTFKSKRKSLAASYAREREQQKIPVQIATGEKITLSPGEHSQLIKQIIEDFAPRFIRNSKLVYVGDTGDKWGYFDEALLKKAGVSVDSHGKMPDVVFFCSKRKWLVLVESVTSHGPMDAKRHQELQDLFSSSSAGLVYVTAFPNRSVMCKYLSEIAWETEVWVADAPSHLIHFDGVRFLGPY